MKAWDKVKGIFTGDTADNQEPINTAEQQKIYDVVDQDYQIFKSARQPIEDHWREEQRFYMGDHWSGLRSHEVSKRRPDAVENITFSQIESIVGKITGWMPYPDFEAQEVNDEQKAMDLNDFMPYELKKIKFKQKHVRAVRRMVIHGPLIYKILFDPTIEGGRGLNRFVGRNDILPVDLGSFFPDPRIKDFVYLQDMGAIIVKTQRPIEYFADRFGDQGKKVQPDANPDDDVFSTDAYDQVTFNYTASVSTYDMEVKNRTAGLLEYWYRGTPKMVSKEDKELFKELAEEKLAQGIDPSEYLAKAEGRMDGVHCVYVSTSGVFLEHKAYVYDHGQYPFAARTLYPDERNVWGKGFMRDMIKPQIFKNKYAEIAVEIMAKLGNSAILYEEGAITKPRTWQEQRSQPGAMLPVAQGRMEDVKEIQGHNVPGSIFNLLNYYDEMLQKIPGQFDSANGQANPNVKSGEQAKALMAAASTRLNTVTDVVTEALEEVFMQYVELIAQFYTNERIARVTGRSVAVSRETLVSKAETTFEQDGEAMPVQEEYIPEFDILVNISVDKPHDREYWLQLAFNLTGVQDPLTGLPMIDAEAIRYVVQNGRMESMDTIKARIEEAANKQQEMQQLQQATEQLAMENESMKGQLQQFAAQRSQEQQADKQFEQGMQQQKMDIEAAKVASQMMR